MTEWTNDDGRVRILNCDCMEFMATLPDKAFELAAVDPPYGIGAENHAGKTENGWTQWQKKRGTHQCRRLRTGANCVVSP